MQWRIICLLCPGIDNFLQAPVGDEKLDSTVTHADVLTRHLLNYTPLDYSETDNYFCLRHVHSTRTFCRHLCVQLSTSSGLPSGVEFWGKSQGDTTKGTRYLVPPARFSFHYKRVWPARFISIFSVSFSSSWFVLALKYVVCAHSCRLNFKSKFYTLRVSTMLELRVNMQWRRYHSTWTLILTDYWNRYTESSLPHLSLCKRLSDLYYKDWGNSKNLPKSKWA